MLPKTHPVTSRQSRALVKLTSWLSASKIPFEIQKDHLILESTVGKKHHVFIIDHPPQNTPILALYVDLEQFWSRDIPTALEAFHKLTQALGRGTPNPLPKRVTAPDYELNHVDYWMRHTEIAISPNPDPQIFKKYEKILNFRVQRFYSANRNLLWEIGWEKDDVASLAMTWLISFDCLHRPLTSEKSDNERLLHDYLKQRMIELHGRMLAMSRKSGYGSVSGEFLDIQLEKLTGLIPDDTILEDESPLTELSSVDGYRNRRKKSNFFLNQSIKMMPKVTIKAKLEDIATDPEADVEVSALAIKRLEKLQARRNKPGKKARGT